MQGISFYFNGTELIIEKPEEIASLFANLWTWFTGLVIPLQIAVVAGLFFLIWGLASVVYIIMKLIAWASYKVWIYVFIGVYAGIYLIVKVIDKASKHKDVKLALNETADKLYGMVEAERNIWSFPFLQEKTKIQA